MYDPSKNMLLANIDPDVLLERYGGRSAYEFNVDAYAQAVEDLGAEPLPSKSTGGQVSCRGSMEIAAAAMA